MVTEAVAPRNGDELRSTDWNVADDVARLLRDTPYMWSWLVLIGAWLGMALGRRRGEEVPYASRE